MNHLRDAHCKEYLAKQQGCFAAPQIGAAKCFVAFRQQIIIIVQARELGAMRERVTLEELRPYQVYAEEIMLTCTDLKERAASLGLDIQANPASLFRYKMIDCCEKGSVFLHASTLMNEMVLFKCIPVDGFSFRRCFVMRDSEDMRMRQMQGFIAEWIKEKAFPQSE